MMAPTGYREVESDGDFPRLTERDESEYDYYEGTWGDDD